MSDIVLVTISRDHWKGNVLFLIVLVTISRDHWKGNVF